MPSLRDNPNIRVVESPRAKLAALQLGNTGGNIQQGGGGGGYSFGGLQMPQGFGGSNAQNIRAMADYQNQLSQYQRQQDAQNAQRNFSLSGGTDPGPMRQMNPFERGLKKGSDFTQGLVNATGWDPSKGFTLGNIMRFGASLPFQMAQGVTEGAEQLYEVGTGRPLLEADSETGLIGTNTLDASQRAASLANAAINIGGLFTGGSARAIGTGANILSKGKAGARMAEGMFGRAMKSPVGQVAYDVAEEGGEEFVQQYLDDTRMKQLDEGTFGRAIEGAKWGALGGGMMSGGSLALRKSMNAIKGKNDQAYGDDFSGNVEGAASQTNRESQVQDAPDYHEELKNAAPVFDSRMTGLQKELREQAGGNIRRVPGAVTLRMSYANPEVKRNDVRISVGALDSTWRSGRDSQIEILNSFRLTPESQDVFTDALYDHTVDGVDYGTASKALTALKARQFGQDGHMVVGLGRNPDTKNGGFYMNVDGFFEGNGLEVHPWVAPIVGMDFDGDQSTIYFNTRKTNFTGFATDMMRNPEARTGSKSESEADWWFGNMNFEKGKSKDEVKRVLSTATRMYAGEGLDDRLDDWSDRFVEASKKGKDGSFSDVLNEIGEAINEASEDRSGWASRHAMEMILGSFEGGLETRARAHVDEIARNVAEAEAEVENKERLSDRLKEDELDDILNRGSTGDSTKPVQIMKWVGGVVYAITKKGNPIFRQYTIPSFDSKDHMMWIDSLKEFGRVARSKDTFSALMRASLRIAATGQSPLDAVEGLIDSAILSRVLDDFEARGGKIRSKEDVDFICESFVKHHDDMVKVYNDSIETLSNRGIIVPYDEVLKNSLGSVDSDGFARAFKRTFGSVPIDTLFDEDLIPESEKGNSFDQFIIPIVEGDGVTTTFDLLMETPGVNSFVNRLIKAYENERNGIHKSLNDVLESPTWDDASSRISKYPVDEDGKLVIPENDESMIFALIDTIALILGPKIALRAGIYGKEILNTRLGRMLFDKRPEIRKNALVCISVNTQFEEALEYFNSEDTGRKAYGRKLLIEMQYISELHRVIATDLLAGNRGALDYFINPEKTFGEKESDINGWIEEGILPQNANIYDLLQTEDSRFALSGMTRQIKEASSAQARAEKHLFKAEAKDARDLKRSFTEYGSSSEHFTAWVNQILRDTMCSIDVDLLGMEAYAAATIANQAKEKATNFDAATQTWASLEISINGGFMSFIDSIMSVRNGVINMLDFTANRKIFMKVLSDPDYSIRVVDPITGESVIMNRDLLIRTVDEHATSLTPDVFFKMLERWPQLTGWLATGAAQPTTAGGVAGATQAKTTTLTDSFNRYMDDVTGVQTGRDQRDFNRTVEYLKKNLEVELLNQPWYRAYLIRCITDIDRKLSLSSLQREMREKHRQAVNGFFSWAVEGKDTSNWATKKQLFIENVLSTLVDDTNAFMTFTIDNLGEIYTNPLASMNTFFTLSDQIAHHNVYAGIRKAFNDANISFDIPEGTSSLRTLGLSDELSGIIGGLQNETSEMVNAMNTFLATFALALEEHPAISFNADPNEMASLFEEIDKDQGLDEAKKQEAKAIIEQEFKKNHALFNTLAPDPNVITAGDIDISDPVNARATLYRKMLAIKGAIGEPVKKTKDGQSDELIDELADVFNSSSKDITAELKKLRIVWNNKYLSQKLKSMSAVTGAHANANAYKALVDFLDNIESFTVDMREKVQQTSGYRLNSSLFSNSEFQVTPPVPSFFNETAELMANQVVNMDISGFVEPTVSMNGGMTKQLWALGYLPTETMGDIDPKPMTIQDLEEMAADPTRSRIRVVAVESGRDLQSIQFSELSTASGMWLRLKRDPNAFDGLNLYFYDPEDNPHGIFDSNTPAPHSLDGTGYKRLRGIFGRLCDFSQEGMVLKAKKNLKSSGVIVSERDITAHKDPESKIPEEQLASSASTYALMRKFLLDYRQNFSDELMKTFDEEGRAADLGYDDEQCLIISQALTPGFIVTSVDESGASHQIMIDASSVFHGPEAFVDDFNKMTMNGTATILSIQIMPASPTEISYRIGRATTEKARDKGSVGGLRKAADEAMNDWSNYKPGTLSVDKIMGHIPHVGYSWNSPLIAPDWRTSMQFVMDELHESTNSAYLNTQLWNSTWTTYMDEKKLGPSVAVGSSIVPKNRTSPRTFVVVRSFIGDDLFGTVDPNKRSLVERLKPFMAKPGEPYVEQINGRVAVTPGMAAICLDEKQASSAIRWGEETGGNVLIDKNVYEKKFMRAGFNRSIGEYTIDINGQKADLVLIVPANDRRFKHHMESGPSAPRGVTKAKDIGVALIDVERMYNTGDASAIGTEALEDLNRPVLGRKKVTVRSLFGREAKQGTVRFASKEEVRALYDRYSNLDDKKAENARIDIAGASEQGFRLTEDVFERDFKSYIDSLYSPDNSGEEGTIRRNTRHGTIIAFAVDDTGNFAPIYLPSKAPLNTDFCDVEIRREDGDIEVSWGGIVGFDEEGSSIKVALAHQAGMKLTVRRFDFDQPKSKPTIPFSIRNSDPNGQQIAHLIVNADTEQSRLPGFDWNLFVKDGWYALRWLGGSVLFDIDDHGKVKWKNDKLTDMQKADLMQGHRNETMDGVISGRITLIDNNVANAREMNRAIQKIFRNCRNYNINFFEAISTFRFDDKGDKIESDFDTRFMMLFDGMTQEEVTWYLHAMNPKLIPEPYAQVDPTKADERTLLDIYGNTLFVIDDTPCYLPGRWGPHMCIGDESSLMMPSGEAKNSPQHMYRRGMDIGYNGDDNVDYLDTEWKDAIEYGNFMLGDIDSVRFKRDDQLSREFVTRTEKQNDFNMEMISTSSWQDIKHHRNMNMIKRARGKLRRIFDGKPDDSDSTVTDPWNHPLIRPIYEELRSKYGEFITWRFIMREVDRQNGYTYDSEAHHQVDVKTVEVCMRQILSRLNKGLTPIGLVVEGSETPKDRFPIAMLSKDEIDFWWKSPEIRNRWDGDKSAFKEAILREAEDCYNQIENITGNESKKKALITAYQIDFESHGYYGKASYVSGGMYLSDIMNFENGLTNAILGSTAEDRIGVEQSIWDELCARERKALMDIKALSKGTNYDRFVVRKDERGRAVVKLKSEDGKVISAILNSAAETSKVMAMLNPAVTVSNFADRGIHQSITRAAIWLGNKLRLGPYASKNPPDAHNIEIAINNQDALDLFAVMRTAELTGDELEFLSIATDMDAVRKWQADKWAEMTPAQKFAAKTYDIQTGSTKLIKGQLRNFLYRFYQFAEVTPGQEFWVRKDSDPGAMSVFEQQITRDDGAGLTSFLIEVMGGHNNESPSFTIAQQAMNHAMMGDMAQRNVFAMVLGEACRKSSLSKFIVTTCVSRFPAYSFNVTHRMLNWVLPMSSIYYVMTERIAEHGHNKAERVDQYTDPHYERAQVHRNLKEAMLVDITHLGFAAVAFILVGMSGGIEPPDDEKKWGNTDEWLIFGHRVGDAWWIEDILGIALPMAAFSKTVQMGKPRMDLLLNGVTDACCSNPMIKVADAVGWLSDPDGSLISRYDRDFEQYQNAKGGPPAITDWMQANSVGFGLNWVSQFFTPSCVREWYQNAQQWERSYKRVYQTNPDGTLSEEGQAGYTEYTTYADAQIRRATRRNPMLGFLADLVLNPTTGYMAGEMPKTVYTDDYQRMAGEYWSINGLSPQEQQQKILEIICEMQSYSSVDDLVKTGFYLDDETRAALGSTCWDIVNEWDNWYYGLQSDGMLDYYVLGNGDFKTGQQIAGDIKAEWINQKKAWSDFYYKKVRELPSSMTKYNRYNTTYEKDVFGDVYASGYRPQGVLPFVSAPGTTTNPEGTAGYENDFMALSAVTGQPLTQRALVPTESEGEMMPALEAWSGDGNGSGYSNLYNNWYGSDGTTGEGGTLSSGLANSGLPGSNTGTPAAKSTYGNNGGSNGNGGSSSRSSSRRRSGGGGYRRRSGGGGGYSSGSPNIYTRYQIPYAQSTNFMGRAYHNRANFDYLRPSWETKGSRESYKREDI